MTTEIKVAFRELAKSVTADVSIRSDELSAEEVLAQAKDLYNNSASFSMEKTMRKSM